MSTEMRERPIIFSAPMVRAILEGRKTQTRRIIKPQPHAPSTKWGDVEECESNPGEWFQWFDGGDKTETFVAPYRVGDVLWVRESFRAWTYSDPHIQYRAGGIGFQGDERCYTIGGMTAKEAQRELDTGKDSPTWRPPIHMPRWAARIRLRVTGVRVERVQSISAADIRAEGLVSEGESFGEKLHRTFEEAWFVQLWDSIHGRGAWERDDWVWVYEFERLA